MKKYLHFLLLVFLFVLSGCHQKTYVPEEILQIPRHTQLYTAHNIWYKDPMNILSDNIQEGKILPFGTKVTILNLTDKEVVFIAEGRKFRMEIAEERSLIQFEDYICQLFTTKNALELTSGVKPVIYEKMRRGIISPGMTRQEVLITCGFPVASRTPSLESTTWIYWVGRVKSVRVIFKDNRVSSIFSLD